MLFTFGRNTQQYDGHGGVVLFFNSTSIRAMERAFGRAPVRKMAEFLNIYKVQSVDDGGTITTGHRSKRINRR